MAWFNDSSLGDLMSGATNPDIGYVFTMDPGTAVMLLADKWNEEGKGDLPDPGQLNLGEWIGQAQQDAALNVCSVGLAAVEKGEFTRALQLFTLTIQKAERVKRSQWLLGDAHSHRSNVYLQLKKYDDALKDAVTAVRYAPTLTTALLNLIKSLVGQEKFGQAFDLSLKVIQKYQLSEESNADMLVECLSVASKVEGAFPILDEVDLDLGEVNETSVWTMVVLELSKRNGWETIKIILFGTDDFAPIVTSFKADDVSLAGLLEFCEVLRWKQWGEKLAVYLLKHGANYNSLCGQRKLPLHVALRKACDTDMLGLLKEVLANQVTQTDIGQVDQDGNSLLHITCSMKSGTRAGTIKLLLSYNVNVMTKNKAGQLAMDLLPGDDPDRELLNEVNPHHTTEIVKQTPGKVSCFVAELNSAKTKSQPLVTANVAQGTDNSASELSSEFIIQRNWSKTRVQKWAGECGLAHYKNKLRELDGPRLHELRILQGRSPDTFYNNLETSLHLSLTDILQISSKLRQCQAD